ncbi:septation protein SepH [Leucobacter denitrificans]|uniref:DUF3071 domain-containing protein n=1 Tax=Leucobacter denitrificans TaxID=683042 RepID=A0A7G9S5N5_9MICO|nr:septation protein SepH [Leucobacter denitrificans]QNN63160.1 DUF3071 domain-containing protein [Leucobacter denitrificans]
MDELRVVRREDNALILANELGEEYRFVVDELAANEVRQLSKKSMGTLSVRPREIQAMLRSGKTRAEVAAETGLEESDVERFEEPVRAEQRYMLDLAHAVPVRTDPSSDTGDRGDEQRFGEVIAERLIGLGNQQSTWRSWRDENAGWMIGLVFDTRDGDHDAIWGFDHRKRVLNPLSPDATNLSKVGDVGDRLIPKLRAVDNDQRERFDSDAFDPDALLNRDDIEEQHSEPSSAEATSAASKPDDDEEYERRREIDQLAVKTDASGDELSETADLLDALRRRRGERSAQNESTPPERTGAAANIWGTAGVSGESADASADDSESPSGSTIRAVETSETVAERGDENALPISGLEPSKRDSKQSRRGRSSIPSWDDILFGTRSDDDPA